VTSGTTQAIATVAALKDALKLVPDVEPPSLDPATTMNTGTDIVMRVFSNLLTFTAQGKLVPEMAAALPSVSADGRTYTFTLRGGLTYSDGTPLAARDFEYAWKRHLDPTVASPSASYGYAIQGAEQYHTADPKTLSATALQRLRDAVGVKATDAGTVVFNLTVPAPWFLSVLATWCGVPVRQADVERGGKQWAQPPTYVGNGPYVLKTWERGRQMIFEANTNYYKGPPPIGTVQYLIINSPADALAAYRANALDVYHFYAPNDLHTIEADSQLNQQKLLAPGVRCLYLGFNCRQRPFDDVRVRQAFSLALDRPRYNHEVMGDLNLAATQLVPPGLPGHYDTLRDTYQRFDPRQAQQLLADAGYPGGKGLPTITIGYFASPINKVRATGVAAQLQRALGISVAVAPIGPDQKDQPSLFWGLWNQGYSDPQDWYSIPFASPSGQAGAGWQNAQFDQLCRQADQELDPAKRAALYQQAAQILNDEAPVAPIVWARIGWLVKPRVTGYQMDTSELFFGQHSLATLKYQPPA